MNPVDLCCRWLGHKQGNELLGVRYTESDDGEGQLSFYISVECFRCGQVQETDVTGLQHSIFTRSWMKRQVDFWRQHFGVTTEQASK